MYEKLKINMILFHRHPLRFHPTLPHYYYYYFEQKIKPTFRRTKTAPCIPSSLKTFT